MRIWFLTHRLPYAPNRGDRIRAYHILRFLRQRADVDLFSLVHDEVEKSSALLLGEQASSVSIADVPKWRNRMWAAFSLYTKQPLTLTLLDAPVLSDALSRAFVNRRPDVVLAYCSGMAPYAMAAPLAQVPMVLDMVDVDSEKWRALAETVGQPKRTLFRREAGCLRAFERRAMQAAAVTTAVTDREAAALRQINSEAAVITVANGVSLESYAPPTAPADSSTVVFCGVLDYAPNEEAAMRLVRHIWPRVILRRPDARLLLVGMNPTSRLRAAAVGASTIQITGEVDDVRTYLWQSAVAAVPLVVARGVQNKVLEALAAGLPTVVSPIVAAGLPEVTVPGTAVAQTDDEFATAILQWLAEPASQRRARAASCDLGLLSWERQLQPLWNALQQAGATGRKAVKENPTYRPVDSVKWPNHAVREAKKD